LKVGGGGQCIGRWGVNTVKTLRFEKGGGCMTPPSAPMVAPPMLCSIDWGELLLMITY